MRVPAVARGPELDLFTGDEQRGTGERGRERDRGITGPDRTTVRDPQPHDTLGRFEAVEGSLRQDGRIVTARISRADYLWLRQAGITFGEALRQFAAAHRGDLEVLRLRERERQIEGRLTALRAARESEEKRLRWTEGALLNSEAVTQAIEHLRPEFVRYITGARKDYRSRLSWVRSRAEELRILRRRDPAELLDALEAEP
jgi:hypothetical protein